MKIHCPNFVPKSGCFYQISVKGLSQTVGCSFFSRQFYDFAFLLKILLFQSRRPSKNSTFGLNFWLFHWKKVKTSTTCKKLRNWWNFNGVKDNSIPLFGILMG